MELGFEQIDAAVTEGRNDSFFLRKFVGDATDDIVLQVIPLTIQDFESFRNNNPGRNFSQDVLDGIAGVDPADCEYWQFLISPTLKF